MFLSSSAHCFRTVKCVSLTVNSVSGLHEISVDFSDAFLNLNFGHTVQKPRSGLERAAVSELLCSEEEIKHLYGRRLAGLDISGIEIEIWEPLLTSFSGFSDLFLFPQWQLNALNLSCTAIGDEKLIDFLTKATERGSLKALTNLNLSGCCLEAPGAIGLAKFFVHMPFLNRLNLSANYIGSDGATAVCCALADTHSKIYVLDLGWNVNIGSAGCAAVATALPHLKYIKCLVLSRVGCDDNGFAALVSSLHCCPSLKTIVLNKNKLTKASSSLLIPLFLNVVVGEADKTSPTIPLFCSLRDVVLSGNKLGLDAAKAVVEVLSRVPEASCCLEHINISGTGLKNERKDVLTQIKKIHPRIRVEC